MVASLKRSWPPAISFSLFMHATLFVYRERLFSLPLILGRPLLSLTNSSTSKPGTELAGFYFSSPGMLPFLEHRHHALRKSKRRPCGERRTRRPYCQLNSQTIANREETVAILGQPRETVAILNIPVNTTQNRKCTNQWKIYVCYAASYPLHCFTYLSIKKLFYTSWNYFIHVSNFPSSKILGPVYPVHLKINFKSIPQPVI